MDLFGFNRFMDGGQNHPPRSGPGLWFQTLWDNLGGLLAGNVLTFIGFLPLALGVSLGLVYENLWITLLSGGAGGALAGVFWAAMLSLSLQAFRGGTRGWFARWLRAVRSAPIPAALAGAVLGLLAGGFLQAGALLTQLLGGGGRPSLLVWAVLCAALFLLSLAAAALFPALCAGDGGGPSPPPPGRAGPGRAGPRMRRRLGRAGLVRTGRGPLPGERPLRLRAGLLARRAAHRAAGSAWA